MSRFTDLYKSMNPEKSPKDSICDNPIMAYMKGVPETEIRAALLSDGWPALDITNLITEAKHAKARAVNL